MIIEFSKLTFPELLAQRAVARIALRRGRRPERTAAVIARIERELGRRKLEKRKGPNARNDASGTP